MKNNIVKILSLFFMLSTGFANPVIEKEDRVILEPFFTYLLTKESLGYVLLGEKPAVLLGYIDHLSWRHPIYSLFGLEPYLEKGNQRRKKAWQTWRKYSSGISDRFLILEELSSDCPYQNIIFVINRDLFCQVVNENREDFEEILKRKITGEELLEQTKDQPLFSVLLKKNEALLGMILGFGRNNSWKFSKEKSLKKLGLFPREEDKVPSIELPVFRADWGDPQTNELREKYLNCRQKIKTTFLDHNPLDQALGILFQ
jgi:hypothetical protein